MKLIDGRELAEKIKDEVAGEISRYLANGQNDRPNLAIILAGEREDSKLYVSLKEQQAKTVGIDTHLYKIAETESENDLVALINFLNNDPDIDGILVQLPLPERFNVDKIIQTIWPTKDVDGFHPQHPDYIQSPVYAAVLECLVSINFDLAGKKVAVLHNSDIFGHGLAEILRARGAQVKTVAVRDFDKLDSVASEEKYNEIKAATSEAAVVISALGLPLFVKDDLVAPESILIDVGIAKVDQRIFGDIDPVAVAAKAAYLTPVPGGIGPMTIALLFKNVWEIFKRRSDRQID